MTPGEMEKCHRAVLIALTHPETGKEIIEDEEKTILPCSFCKKVPKDGLNHILYLTNKENKLCERCCIILDILGDYNISPIFRDVMDSTGIKQIV